MAMVPPRSLSIVGAFGAMEKCLWCMSMKLGDNDKAMGVWSIASPSTTKPQVQSLYHPWLLYPRGLYRNLELVHEIWLQRQHHGGMVVCKSLYRQITSSEPISSMAMVPPRSLPKLGAFEAMEKCLRFFSMKFGDNDNAMGVSSIASPCTTKPHVESLYHPWQLYPRGLYRNLDRLELWKSVFGPCP